MQCDPLTSKLDSVTRKAKVECQRTSINVSPPNDTVRTLHLFLSQLTYTFIICVVTYADQAQNTPESGCTLGLQT